MKQDGILLDVYVPFLLPRNITMYFESETSRHFSTLYVGGEKQKNKDIFKVFGLKTRRGTSYREKVSL